MSSYKALVITGYPGSGKGTTAKMLMKYPGFHHLSTGELFESIKEKKDRSINEVEAWKCMVENKYVPDEITLDLFKLEIIRRVGCFEYDPKSQLLVLDGIPRTPAQIQPVEKFVDVIQTLYINIGNDFEKVKKIVVPRIFKRARNKNDKNPDKIIERIKQYKSEETFKIVDYYRAKNLVIDVPNTGSVEALHMFVERYAQSVHSQDLF